MERISNQNRSCSVVASARNTKTADSKAVQVLYLGEKGKLTYAGSGRTVSRKLSEKLGISKFNFF
ncbi:MAG: hypothetical protein Q4D07_06850 [Selenomonadaceae bacterium]|nr:hypothetical protein [Selenomonadaceae bacterium]